ncbi:MAG: cytochrome c oxidase subunit 3, partial [Bacteroidota bacterium]
MDQILTRPIENATKRNRIHPHKLALWVGLASIMMMFTALTSAYIVRMAAGNWLEFRIPEIFYWNTAVIVASSITLHLSYLAFKQEKALPYRALLSVTFVLGLLFLYLQYVGWEELAKYVPLKTNPAGDFVYVLSWLHAAHVVGGIAILVVALIIALFLPVKATPARKLRFQLSLTYWHFIDLLWIYL